MKYKIGEKVRYDGGDWWFYGTVSAVFEHSLSPCYRLDIERMVKKSCRFSITQFEFDLEPEQATAFVDGFMEASVLPSELETVKRRRRKKAKQESKSEKEEVSQKLGKEALKPKISEAWLRNLELYQKGERNASIYNWMSIIRKLYQSGELPDDKKEKLSEIGFPFVADRKRRRKTEKPHQEKKERQKRKKSEAWDMYLESYRNGDKSNTISSWIAQNRKEYKEGNLTEKKLDKLMGVNFPFETSDRKKNDSWHQRLDEWKNGERRSTLVQQWRQRSIKYYQEGKLEIDKVAKLKEIGILK